MIRSALQGFEREMYSNKAIVLNEECLSDFYVQKQNEYEYLWYEDPFENFYQNFFPELQMTYMFYYMLANQCDVADTLNDFMIYCWYKGCWPRQILNDSMNRIFYILRSINNAAIMWYEEIPHDQLANTEEEQAKYVVVADKVG